jgi:serine/threonine-protein kinase
MMNTSKNQFSIARGTIIHGKWHKRSYLVERELGYGATGSVYLVKCREGSAALKVSSQLSITSEMNVLKAFEKVQGTSLGPSLFDVDDWENGNSTLSFYVMEYIHGPTLSSFIQKKDTSWIGVLLLQLLENLQALHTAGWIFGDIKPDNLIVTGPPFCLRCIDVGGTTKQGRAIKEYTEFFDRGYWGAGSRKAEPAYDLFATAMVAVNLVYPKRFERDEKGIDQVLTVIQQNKELQAYSPVLRKALLGHYATALEMRKDLLLAIAPAAKKDSPSRSMRRMRTTPGKTAFKQKKQKQRLLESAVIVMSVLLLYVLYVLFELLA